MRRDAAATNRSLSRAAVAFSLCFIVIAACVFSGQMWMREAERRAADHDAAIAAVRAQALNAARLTGRLLAGETGDALAPAVRAVQAGRKAVERAQALAGGAPDGGARAAEGATILIRAATATIDGGGLQAAGIVDALENRVVPGLAALETRLMEARNAAAGAAARRGAISNYAAIIVLTGMALFLHRPLLRRFGAEADARLAVEIERQRALRTDALTGLANREGLRRRLGELFADREGSGTVCALHYDLVRFRELSRRFGDAAADAAVRRVARIIRDLTRDGDLVARIGPDEFCVIPSGPMSPSEMEARARRVLDDIAAPCEIDGARVQLGAVAAAAAADAATSDPERLISNVEIALAEAKLGGAGSFCLYSRPLRAAFEARNRLGDELAIALKEDQIEAYVQPQIRLGDGAVIGVEALARWRHPQRGALTPAAFLYTAEELGLGPQIDERVMEKALDALAAWRAAGEEAAHVSVNFAAGRLADPFLIEKIRWAVETRDLDPGDMRIEILESVLIDEEGDEIAQNVESLSRAGFGVDLDDFGTGYASIATLRRCPIQRLKIDRSFIRGVDLDPERRKLVAAMMTLAHSLGAETLAEGVETEGELQALAALGCDYAQGFRIAAPMPAAAYPGWRRGRRALPALADTSAAG